MEGQRWIITFTKKLGEISIKEKKHKEMIEVLKAGENSELFKRVLKKSNYIMGSEVDELEKKLQHYTNSKYCVTCSSGTDALILALLSLKIGRGDLVVCPSFTFPATAEAILITGANGFIGMALCKVLHEHGHFVRAIVRDIAVSSDIEGIEMFEVGSINYETDWSKALKNIDYVVHCAALTNFKCQNEKDILETYREVNVEGSRRLAEQAVNAGVQRLLLISSIKFITHELR